MAKKQKKDNKSGASKSLSSAPKSDVTEPKPSEADAQPPASTAIGEDEIEVYDDPPPDVQSKSKKAKAKPEPEPEEDEGDEDEDEDESEDEAPADEDEDDEADDADEDADEDEDEEDDEEDEEEPPPPPPKPASKKGKPAPSKVEAKPGKDKPAATKPSPARKAAAPRNGKQDVSVDVRAVFGLRNEAVAESPEDYDTEGEYRFPVKGLLLLLVVLGILGGGGYFAKTLLDKRQKEIDEAADKAAQEAAGEGANQERYGHLSILGSIPPNAVILQDGKPIYAKAGSGAVTELRASPSTRIQNIKIDETKPLQYTLVGEGYRPYTLSIAPSDWLPQPGTADFEKAYSSVRLEPITTPLLTGCEAISALGPAYASACSLTVVDEILTRLDFERLYQVRLTGSLIIKSDPPGARVVFNAKPLMLQTDSGTESQAITSSDPNKPLTVRVVGKIPAPLPPPPEPGAPPAPPVPPAPPLDKLIDITDEISVRLELDGYDPYVTHLSFYQWHCDPIVDLAELADPLRHPVPLKSDTTAPDLLHHVCRYTYTVEAKLQKPAPEEPGKPNAASPK